MRPWVSLVIASYNSGREIEKTLCHLQQYFEKQPYLHEVLVVNDGSRDSTGACLSTFAQHYPELRVLANDKNMGKGYSIRKGMLEATGRFIFYTDADLAYPIEGIETFLPPLHGGRHAAVVGSRVHADSCFHLHPRHFRYIYRRYLMSRCFNRLVRRLFEIRVLDTQCGFKGFTAEAAKTIFPLVRLSGFAFDVEVLLIAQRFGFKVAEIPVNYAYDGEISTVQVWKGVAEVLVDLARLCHWDFQGKYPPRH